MKKRLSTLLICAQFLFNANICCSPVQIQKILTTFCCCPEDNSLLTSPRSKNRDHTILVSPNTAKMAHLDSAALSNISHATENLRSSLRQRYLLVPPPSLLENDPKVEMSIDDGFIIVDRP